MNDAQGPKDVLVSIVVCTRNRGANALPTVRSILASQHRRLELFLLDQSDNDETQRALAGVATEDSRFRYERMPVPGKPRALNRARSLARGELILLTDDDCEVLPDWIDGVLREFEKDASVGCLFGRVEAGPHDESEAFVPVCPIEQPKTIRHLPELLTMPGWGNFGMGANMSIRSAALQHLHGWDECIGPGAKFGSGDDHDLSVRLLRAGYAIRFSPEPRVVHFGLRRWRTAGRDYRRIWFGVGGVFAKHLRCGAFYPGGIRVPVNQLRNCTKSLLKGSKPYGLSYVGSWLSGFAAGLLHPLDRGMSQFQGDAKQAARYADRVADVVLRDAPRDSGSAQS